MLVYHPAFDLHHCVFRLVRILNRLPMARYHAERIRILDFYLLFPTEIPAMRFPKGMVRHKNRFKKRANKYNRLLDRYQLFLRLEPYQAEALGCLAAHDLISPEALGEGFVAQTSRDIPDRLKRSVEEADDRDPDAIELLTGPLMDIPLYGRNGLRGRTELFEYRYDPA